VPAPAVIPALIAYVKVVAVKTLVVGIRSSETRLENPGLAAFRGALGDRVRWAVVKRAIGCPSGHRVRLSGRARLVVPFTMTKLG
jgi:hypothetical protein